MLLHRCGLVSQNALVGPLSIAAIRFPASVPPLAFTELLFPVANLGSGAYQANVVNGPRWSRLLDRDMNGNQMAPLLLCLGDYYPWKSLDFAAFTPLQHSPNSIILYSHYVTPTFQVHDSYTACRPLIVQTLRPAFQAQISETFSVDLV